MNQNKFMSLLLGEHCHVPYVSPTGQTSRYRCGDPTCMFHKHQSLDPLWRDIPVYHDFKNRMTLETMDKIIEKMPGVWEKYIEWAGWQVTRTLNHHDIVPQHIDFILSLSNFIDYLREHKEEWAYTTCVEFKDISMVTCGDCKDRKCNWWTSENGSIATTGKILNPAYAEALRELEEGE